MRMGLATREALAVLTCCLTCCVACGSATGTHPPVGSPLTVDQLTIAVLDAVGPPVYCDPDFYPLARAGGEQASAIAKYPAIRDDSAVYEHNFWGAHLGSRRGAG